jgi:Leucine-rich repeat (LRR) protein
MRQQKHKSSRSAYPDSAHHLVQKIQNDPRSMRTNQGRRSSSSNSFSSNTTAIKSLSEVKNPPSLITFRFVNRGVTTLEEIQKFRNLTELDVSGNQLRFEVPELKRLTFLKKLSIAKNQIEQMWALPTTLEFLNISQNQLQRFEP